MPVPDVVPGHTRKYQSLKDTAKIAKLSRYHLNTLIERDMIPAPDVIIGTVYPGWDEDRFYSFCVEAELIYPDGGKYKTPTGRRRDIKGDKVDRAAIAARVAFLRDLATNKYRTRTKVYLGNTLVSAVYNLAGAAIYQARDREKFLPADIVVSTRFGWDEMETLRFGRQSGRIGEDDVTTWAVRRSLAFDLPLVDWVWDLAEATDAKGHLLHPEIRNELTAAGKWVDRPAPDPQGDETP